MTGSKVVIVTGASRGIGLAVARWLLVQKHKIVVIARSQGPLDELRRQHPEQVQVLSGDVVDFTLGGRAHELALSAWGGLDGLVLNHGIVTPVQSIADADISEWRKAFDVNYFSYVSFIKACLPSLRASKGKIILCSSGASNRALSTMAPYGTTKAAVNRLAAFVAAEEPDVTTLAVRPGMVETDMQRELREDYTAKMSKATHDFFTIPHQGAKLLRPDQPGSVMAKLSIEAPETLSGEFISWDDERLVAFRETSA